MNLGIVENWTNSHVKLLTITWIVKHAIFTRIRVKRTWLTRRGKKKHCNNNDNNNNNNNEDDDVDSVKILFTWYVPKNLIENTPKKKKKKKSSEKREKGRKSLISNYVNQQHADRYTRVLSLRFIVASTQYLPSLGSVYVWGACLIRSLVLMLHTATGLSTLSL